MESALSHALAWAHAVYNQERENQGPDPDPLQYDAAAYNNNNKFVNIKYV